MDAQALRRELQHEDQRYRAARLAYEEAQRDRITAVQRATDAGMTQHQIAEVLGIYQPNVGRLLSRGKRTRTAA